MIPEAVLAATLVVMVDGTTIQTPMDSYVECQRSAKLLKQEDRDAFCIPRQKEMDRVRDMMWDFMDVIDAIRDRDERGKCIPFPEIEDDPEAIRERDLWKPKNGL